MTVSRRSCAALAAVALAGAALSGCATRAGRAVALTPSTELGTIVLRVRPDAGAVPAVVFDAGRAPNPADAASLRAVLGRLVADAQMPRVAAERMVRLAADRTRERLVLSGTAAAAGDTLLDLSIADVGLVTVARPGEPAAPAGDPALTLVVNGSLRLQRANDGGELLARPIRYLAETKALSAWAKDDARELRNALGPAVEALAAALVDELF